MRWCFGGKPPMKSDAKPYSVEKKPEAPATASEVMWLGRSQ